MTKVFKIIFEVYYLSYRIELLNLTGIIFFSVHLQSQEVFTAMYVRQEIHCEDFFLSEICTT
jgi:hypothetical protein